MQEKDIRNLYRFIDWVMILPKALEAEFWEEFKEFEEERTMSYITTGEWIGYERGEQEGEQKLVMRLLQRRVGELPQEVIEEVQNLSLEKLEALGEALLDFTSMDDLLNWLRNSLSKIKTGFILEIKLILTRLILFIFSIFIIPNKK